MPIYRCPKCGRTVEKPEGTYYCKVCGRGVIMQKLEDKPLSAVNLSQSPQELAELDVSPLIKRAWRAAYPYIVRYARRYNVSVPEIRIVGTIKSDERYPLAQYSRPTKSIQISISKTKSLLVSETPSYGIDTPFLIRDVLVFCILHEFYHHVQHEKGRYKEIELLIRAGRHEEAFYKRIDLEEEATAFARKVLKDMGISFSRIKYIAEKAAEGIL